MVPQPPTFSDEVTPDIDFNDEALVQCNVSVAKILLQMVVVNK